MKQGEITGRGKERGGKGKGQERKRIEGVKGGERKGTRDVGRERELNHLSSEVKHGILFVRNESLMPALVEQVSNHHKFFGFSLCSTSFG